MTVKTKIRKVLFNQPIGYSFYKILRYQYYSMWKFAAAINHYRIFTMEFILRRHSGCRLHLGCGNIYLNGWVNIDNYIGKRKKDLWLDIAIGLPFRNNSIEAIFTSHVLEHFIIEDILRILSECFRVLKTDGCLRIAVPSLTIALKHYQKGEIKAFPRIKGRTVSRRFIDYILYHNTHLTMFDFAFLHELLEDVGFRNIEEKAFLKSDFFYDDEIVNMDKYEAETLFVECRK